MGEESWSWDVMEKIFLSECVGVEIFFVGPVVKLGGGVRRGQRKFFLARGRETVESFRARETNST